MKNFICELWLCSWPLHLRLINPEEEIYTELRFERSWIECQNKFISK